MEALLRELEERIPAEETKKKFRALLKKIDFVTCSHHLNHRF